MTRPPIGSCVRWWGLGSVWMSTPTLETVQLEAVMDEFRWSRRKSSSLWYFDCVGFILSAVSPGDSLSDTIYPKFNPQHIDVCLFFVLCPAKVRRSRKDSPCEFSAGGCSYIKMLYSCVCSVATGYYFTKLPKKLHLGSSFCGVLVGKSTQRSATVKKRLLYCLKQRTNRR